MIRASCSGCKVLLDCSYNEGKRKITISGEMLSGASELLVSISAVKSWNPPYNGEIIGQSKREQISANISAALECLGIAHEFD